MNTELVSSSDPRKMYPPVPGLVTVHKFGTEKSNMLLLLLKAEEDKDEASRNVSKFNESNCLCKLK